MGSCHFKCISADTIVSPRYSEGQLFRFTESPKPVPREVFSTACLPSDVAAISFQPAVCTAHSPDQRLEELPEQWVYSRPHTFQEMVAELGAILRGSEPPRAPEALVVFELQGHSSTNSSF